MNNWRFPNLLFSVSLGIVISFLLPGYASAQNTALVFPKDNVVTSGTALVFEWNTVPGAIEYNIQIDFDDSTFSLPITIDLTSTATTYNSVPLSSGIYYWRVSADTGTGFNDWSPVWSFRIFSPNDLNAITWYKADFGVMTDSSGRVYQWNDASPSNNHAAQTDANAQPQYISSAPEINNYPLLRFDGRFDYISFSTPLSSLETVFWVIRENPAASRLYRSLLGDVSQEPRFHRGCCDGGFPGLTAYVYDDVYPVGFTSVRNGSTQINCNQVDPTITKMPKTMSIISTRTTGNAKADNFSKDRNILENDQATGQQGYRVWYGDLAELIFFNEPLSDPDIQIVTDYLVYKYAPPVNLGADIIHSYKLCDNITLSSGYYKHFNWSTGDTSNSIQINEPGIYWVEATNQFDKISYDTVIVEFARPNVISDTTICSGSSLIWNTELTGAYSFLWSNGSSSSSYTISSTGDYWVEVSDSTGCSFRTDTVHVEIDSFSAVASLGPDVNKCRNQRIGLVSGAQQAVSHLWNTGATSAEVTITASGTYSLTATDANGCEAIDDIVVAVTLDAPIVNFTAPAVCLGEATSFVNLTSGTPNVIGWQWDFGDTFSDTQKDPSHAYASPGDYIVKLTATADNACVNDISKTVTVHSLPHALFSDTVFCIGLPRQFYNRSIPGDSAIINWFWDFGDSTSSILRDPMHQYDSLGAYNVKLQVSDVYGCSDSFNKMVNVVLGVLPADTPRLISPKDNVALTDSAVLFNWNPSAGVGYYTLQIAADPGFNNPIQAIDLFEDSVVVSNLPFTTGYYYWRVIAVNLCGTTTPSSVQRFLLFTPDIISGNCLWLSADFGTHPLDINGNVQQWTDRSPASNNASQTSGTRRPKFIASVPELNGKPALEFDGIGAYIQFSMIDSIRTVFWIIKEDNNASPFYRHLLGNSLNIPDFHRGCCNGQFPGTVKYIFGNFAATEVLQGQTWLNENRIIATDTDAPTQYSILSHLTTGITSANCFVCDRTDVVPFPFPSDKRFWDGNLAELIIYCKPLSDSEIEVVESYLHTKYAPPVNLGPDIVRGYGLCNPVKLKVQDHFVKYIWEVPGISNVPDTNTVDFYGSGIVRIAAVDIFGDTTFDEIEVIGGLQNPFKDTVFVCLGDSVVWNTGLSHNYTFKWNDNSTDSFFVISKKEPVWVEVTDGTGCLIRNDVYANVDSFSIQATLGGDTALCTNNRISLITKAEETASYSWSNGDSLPFTIVIDPGSYSLTATNIHECVSVDSIQVSIYGIAPQADFSFSNVCINDLTQFTDLTQPNDIVSWLWDFDDGATDSVQHPVHLLQDTGRYNVKLTVKDSEACFQNITKPVTIYSLPVTSFTYNPVNCANDFVEFHGLSSATAQNIASRLWTFGDSGTDNSQDPLHKYQDEGLYAISLSVVTDQGCIGSAFDTIEIFPELRVAMRVENLCIDNTLTRFYDASPGFSNVACLWNFGDNTATSQLCNPSHSYIEAGKYVVSFQVTNALGCIKAIEDTVNITDSPVADFDNPDLCEGELFRFTDKTITNGGDNVVMWNWEFGDGSFSTQQNPNHVYSKDSSYSVKLSVITGNGCSNSAAKTIEVTARPVAAFDYTPKYGAAPLPITFTNLSTNATNYIWDFGDESLSSNAENPFHTYQQNGKYTITLVASNLPGCSDTAVHQIDVVVPLFDIGIDEIILTSTANHTGCLLDMVAVIINHGTVDVTSFDIRAHNSAGGTIEDHWQGAFPNTRELQYNFSVQFVIDDCSDVVVCMDVSRPNGQPDQNPSNDHLCSTLSDDFVIIGPYPNPTGDFVRLDIMLPSSGNLKITNYNVVGQKLAMIEDPHASKGYYPVSFDVKHLKSGVYFLKIEHKDEERILKYEVR